MTRLGGIGFAVCDSRDRPLFEVAKPMAGAAPISRPAAEIAALLEGLNAALDLGLQRIIFYCDYHPLYMFVTRRWLPKRRKIQSLVTQVFHLQKKFKYCGPFFVARRDVKYAFKLARNAVVSQINRASESSCLKSIVETCVICLEDTNVDQVFSVNGCLHRYCFSCMRQHVEAKLLHGVLPKCPHEGCRSELDIENCRRFLTPRLIEMMSQRIKEASIPVAKKVYCPYPRCSALMSTSEAFEYTSKTSALKGFGARKCLKCHSLFCVYCKVPWHENMSCVSYKKLCPDPPAEDAKLKGLASRNLWRQCVNCQHMIELSEGCFHMTCRCGYEFCYKCGAEWKNKKPTCSCPLWEEDYIFQDIDEEDYTDREFDEDEEDEEDYGYMWDFI